MSLRIRTHGSTTVYAGSAAELADVADGYAGRGNTRPRGYDAELFRRTADDLRRGARVIDLGALRFYADRADGAPFKGPLAPEPDPEWAARQLAFGAAASA